jgi:osmoprotectant transport system substrate-binding protein
MRRTTRVAAVLAAVTLAVSACGNSDPTSSTTGASKAPSGSITIGSANFPENSLLAEIYAGALEAKGIAVTKRLNIGNREAYIKGLQDSSIDLIPEYSGSLLFYFDKKAAPKSIADVTTELGRVLPSGLTALTPSAAADVDTLVVSKETAAKYNLTSVDQLAPIAKELVVGGPPEFKSRVTGLVGLKDVYGIEFKEFKPLDVAGPLTVGALKNNSVQVANLFSTQSAIKSNGFVALADPKNVFGFQNVTPLINKSKASAAVTDILNSVSAKLTTQNLADAVYQVEVDKKAAAEVAKGWLLANGFTS